MPDRLEEHHRRARRVSPGFECVNVSCELNGPAHGITFRPRNLEVGHKPSRPYKTTVEQFDMLTKAALAFLINLFLSRYEADLLCTNAI